MPTNTDDVIDSREIIARIDDLETDEDNLEEDEREELASLRALAVDAGGSGQMLLRRSLVVGDRIVAGGDPGVVVGVSYRGRRALICDFPNYRGGGVTRRFRMTSGEITRAEGSGSGSGSVEVGEVAS